MTNQIPNIQIPYRIRYDLLRSYLNEDEFQGLANIDKFIWGGFTNGILDSYSLKRMLLNSRTYLTHFPSLKQFFNSIPLCLDYKTWIYGFHRKIQVEEVRTNPKKKDYEACDAGGYVLDNVSYIAFDKSGEMRRNDCNILLWNKFNNIFGVYPPNKPKNANCKNNIGNCAEQHVINNLMNKTNATKDFMISIGVRPRTLELIQNCANCKLLISSL